MQNHIAIPSTALQPLATSLQMWGHLPPPIPFSPLPPPASKSPFLKDVLDTVINQLPATPAGVLCCRDNNPTLKRETVTQESL